MKKYLTIAHCADGDVVINNKGKEYSNSIEEANELRNAHLSLCDDIEIVEVETPKTYHIKGYADMQSMIEVNFKDNEFKNLKEAYKAVKENLKYCDMEITEPSTELRMLFTDNQIEIWNEKPKVHFKQQRPRTYKELEKIVKEVFLS